MASKYSNEIRDLDNIGLINLLKKNGYGEFEDILRTKSIDGAKVLMLTEFEVTRWRGVGRNARNLWTCIQKLKTQPEEFFLQEPEEQQYENNTSATNSGREPDHISPSNRNIAKLQSIILGQQNSFASFGKPKNLQDIRRQVLDTPPKPQLFPKATPKLPTRSEYLPMDRNTIQQPNNPDHYDATGYLMPSKDEGVDYEPIDETGPQRSHATAPSSIADRKPQALPRNLEAISYIDGPGIDDNACREEVYESPPGSPPMPQKRELPQLPQVPEMSGNYSNETEEEKPPLPSRGIKSYDGRTSNILNPPHVYANSEMEVQSPISQNSTFSRRLLNLFRRTQKVPTENLEVKNGKNSRTPSPNNRNVEHASNSGDNDKKITTCKLMARPLPSLPGEEKQKDVSTFGRKAENVAAEIVAFRRNYTPDREEPIAAENARDSNSSLIYENEDDQIIRQKTENKIASQKLEPKLLVLPKFPSTFEKHFQRNMSLSSEDEFSSSPTYENKFSQRNSEPKLFIPPKIPTGYEKTIGWKLPQANIVNENNDTSSSKSKLISQSQGLSLKPWILQKNPGSNEKTLLKKLSRVNTEDDNSEGTTQENKFSSHRSGPKPLIPPKFSNSNGKNPVRKLSPGDAENNDSITYENNFTSHRPEPKPLVLPKFPNSYEKNPSRKLLHANTDNENINSIHHENKFLSQGSEPKPWMLPKVPTSKEKTSAKKLPLSDPENEADDSTTYENKFTSQESQKPWMLPKFPTSFENSSARKLRLVSPENEVDDTTTYENKFTSQGSQQKPWMLQKFPTSFENSSARKLPLVSPENEVDDTTTYENKFTSQGPQQKPWILPKFPDSSEKTSVTNELPTNRNDEVDDTSTYENKFESQRSQPQPAFQPKFPNSYEHHLMNYPHNRPLPSPPKRMLTPETSSDYSEEEEDMEYDSCILNLNDEPFYRNTDRKGAKRLLEGLQDGAFLLRPSKVYFLTLTIKYKEGHFNMGVLKTKRNKLRCQSDTGESPEFSTVKNFIEHFTQEPLTFNYGNGIIHLLLKKVLPSDVF